MQGKLRDRLDLIDLVARTTSLPPAVKRATLTGTVEVMGGFEEISGSESGWVLSITAKHGTKFLVAVIPSEIYHNYRARLIDRIPWESWVGTPLAGATYSIYQGDHPAVYDARRDAERQRQKI